jgi:hypothetical protein
MKFVKDNIQSVKGRQPTKYDHLLEAFENPGDRIKFEESECSRATASQIAKRLMILAPGKQFHSGFDVLEKLVFVRLRVEGEIPSKEEVKEQEEGELNLEGDGSEG